MSWSTPADLKAQLARRWERGELAAALVGGASPFPLRLVLKAPGSAELADRFDAVRAWAAELAAMRHVRIAWREVRHRVHGLQRLPEQAWVDGLEDALAMLGKQREAERLAELVQATRARLPALLPWLARRPLQAIALAPCWPALLAVVEWVAAHPRPAVYLRQVDVPGVHSKFIEAHRVVLAELLDLVLPPEAVRQDVSGAGRFAARYGFLEKPVRIRLRLLDERIRLLPGAVRHPDLSLDAASFAGLDVPVRRVFITENETNFLAFPPAEGAIVVFGAGYGWEALASAGWLQHCAVWYWGDIDTHGFAILDQLRGHLPHARSLLMERETLQAHRAFWGEEPEQVLRDLPRLTAEERGVFDDLRDSVIGKKLRLEQERVGFGWVLAALGRCGNA